MANKKMKIDLKKTLLEMRKGDVITFVIAGEGRETTYSTLQALRTNLQLPLKVKSIENGMKAEVIHL